MAPRLIAALIAALALCSGPAHAGSRRLMRVSLTYESGGLPARLSPRTMPAHDLYPTMEIRTVHSPLTPFERSFVVRLARVFLDPVPVLAFGRMQVRFKILLE
ncbi:MAG: hypothetical protein WC728_18705 [Elusimicrobiota bacterium]